jgi:uncharacterized protein
LKDLLVTLAAALVEEPDRVSVRATPREGATLLELTVARGDHGRVIGREGRTAAALRTVLEAAARRRGERVQLEIRE